MEATGKKDGSENQVSLFQGFKVLKEKVEASHSKEHEQRIGATVLRETDVVSHKGQRERAGYGNVRRN